MDIQKFDRRPLSVEGVQVTNENITEVALWCGGEILADAHGRPYIHVDVKHPIGERQTKAFIRDWVLSSSNGFKVFTEKALPKSFIRVDEEPENVLVTSNVFVTKEQLEETPVNPLDQISGKTR